MGRRELSLLNKLCALHRKRRIMHMILLEEEVAEEEEEEEMFEARGTNISKEKSLIFISYIAIEMDTKHPHVNFLGLELSRKEMQPKI